MCHELKRNNSSSWLFGLLLCVESFPTFPRNQSSELKMEKNVCNALFWNTAALAQSLTCTKNLTGVISFASPCNPWRCRRLCRCYHEFKYYTWGNQFRESKWLAQVTGSRWRCCQTISGILSPESVLVSATSHCPLECPEGKRSEPQQSRFTDTTFLCW